MHLVAGLTGMNTCFAGETRNSFVVLIPTLGYRTKWDNPVTTTASNIDRHLCHVLAVES